MEYGENTWQVNIILQWTLEKGMRFYVQMLVPFIPHPYNSRVEMRIQIKIKSTREVEILVLL